MRESIPPLRKHQETTMNDQRELQTECVPLIPKAAERAEQLENVAGQAFCRLTALAGMLTRLQELARARDAKAVEAVVPDAKAACRDAEILLRYFDSRQLDAVRVGANRTSRPRTRAWRGGGMADGA
jgi:hypothetical protein